MISGPMKMAMDTKIGKMKMAMERMIRPELQ